MEINTQAFLDSLPIMGSGLLGIFIVTAVIIIGIYILKVATKKKAETEANSAETVVKMDEREVDPTAKKESAMDLMKEREKKDFLESDDTFTISNDL